MWWSIFITHHSLLYCPYRNKVLFAISWSLKCSTCNNYVCMFRFHMGCNPKKKRPNNYVCIFTFHIGCNLQKSGPTIMCACLDFTQDAIFKKKHALHKTCTCTRIYMLMVNHMKIIHCGGVWDSRPCMQPRADGSSSVSWCSWGCPAASTSSTS